jgi:ABC-2 type transport system permease protein
VAGVNSSLTADDSVLPSHAGPFSPIARQQYAALIWLQSRIFLNGIRTMRGSFELGARILTGFLFFVIAVGPAFGLGFAAWAGVTNGSPLAVAIPLWVLCGVWQVFSALVPALAGQNPDLAHLLRFPVSFSSWILLFLIYGVCTPSTLIGLFWAIGIGIGVTVARPDLFLSTAVTLALLVFFNILLSRTILAWVERWMAQRRTREIFTGIILILALVAQSFNPAFHNYGRRVHGQAAHQGAPKIPAAVWTVQAALPPGLATAALVQPMRHQGSGTLPLVGLGLYIIAIAGLLVLRLRAESHGENLSEAPRTASPASHKVRRAPFLDFSGPIAAVFEKDLLYLLRSGPMLYALAAPLVMVFLFGGAMRSGSFGHLRAQYALPLALVWAFLGLTRLVTNNLGGDGQGLYLYFLSPTPLRSVILGKNALHLMLFLLEAVLITGLVIFRFGLPAPSVAGATLAWILFAVPANFAIGNLLSILMPYRMNMSRMRKEPGALGNGLLSTLTQVAVLGIAVLVYLPCAAFDHPWLATPILLALAAVSTFAYLRILANVDRLLQSKQESLLLELARTA